MRGRRRGPRHEVPAAVATPDPTTGIEIRRLIPQAVFRRFAGAKPMPPIEWLSDNEGIYTALETLIEAERHHSVPSTRRWPVRSRTVWRRRS